MGTALLGFAMVLAGASAPTEPKPEPVNLSYLVTYIDAKGLDWREAALADLRPLSRQRGAMVWIASSGAIDRLFTGARANSHTTILQAPRIVGRAGDAVHAHSRGDVSVATKVSFAAGTPRVEPEKIRAGWMTTMVGRKLDQGILVRMVAENTAVLAVHHVALKGGAMPSTHTAKVTFHSGVVRAHGTSGVIDGDSHRTSNNDPPVCCANCAKDEVVAASAVEFAEPPTVKLDVPEVDTLEVAGEWLIGPDEGLVVSFGVHTVADEHGKAVVGERLIVVRAHQATPEEGSINGAGVAAALPVPQAMPRSARVWARALRLEQAGTRIGSPGSPLASPPLVPPPIAMEPIPFMPPLPPVPMGVSVPALPAMSAAMAEPVPIDGSAITIPIPPRINVRTVPLPSPAAPSRTIPQGVDADGNPASLPRLPEDDEPDVDASETSEPLPSPQTRKPMPRMPASDTATKRTSFIPPPISLAAPFIASLTSPTRFQFMIPLKPISLRLPFNQRLEFEIVGRLVDAPSLRATE